MLLFFFWSKREMTIQNNWKTPNTELRLLEFLSLSLGLRVKLGLYSELYVAILPQPDGVWFCEKRIGHQRGQHVEVTAFCHR